MDKKRIGLIILFSLVSVILAYAMYRIFFYQPARPSEPTAPGEISPGEAFPRAGEGEPRRPGVTQPGRLPAGEALAPEQAGPAVTTEKLGVRVVDNIVDNAGIDPSGDMKFYSRQDGKFYRYSDIGGVEPLTDQVFYNVEKVTWSPTRNESIIEYPDGSNIYYNFDNKKQTTLPKHWQEFDFSPTGDRIAAKSMGLSPENRWLVTSDPQGSSIQAIEPLGSNADKVIVDWSPNRQIVALSTTGEALGGYRQEVLFIGLHGENLPSTIVEGNGLQTSWSQNGQKLLYSVYSPRSEYKPELWAVNAEGQNIGTERKALNVNTWAEKCTFQDDRYVYCGVPVNLNTGAGFNPEMAESTMDEIYRIDTQTGLKTLIELDSVHTVDNIFIGDDGHTLYFTDKNTDGLFSVDI